MNGTWRTATRPMQRSKDGFWHVPAVATLRTLSHTTGVFYLLGGLVAWIRSADLTVPGGHLLAIRGIAALAMVIGPLSLAAGARLPRATYHVLVGLGTALITVITLLSEGSVSPEVYALIYILVIIDAAFFFSWLGMLLHTFAVQVACAWVLTGLGVPAGTTSVYLGIFLCVSFTVAWLARVADRAEQDPLTTLPNRRALARNLESTIEDAGRTGEPLSVVIIDLDHFKLANDTLGHAAGDELLIACAKHWRAITPDPRHIYRYGGDEFAVLLPGLSLGRAAELADRLRTGLPGGTTASVGVATWEHGDSGSMLMSRADVALYDAKSNGRDQTAVYGDPGHAARELEAAIAGEQMVMHYQPVVRLADGEVTSFEALVRWEHPTQGLVAPQAFVGQAERTGAIHALGAWTLEQACLATAQRHPSRTEHTVSVNVSITELRNPAYATMVRNTLARSGLSPERLVVEVTEAVYDNDDDQVATTLEDLRAIGVRIAIDDFGSGYSSLRWLSKFPLDILKIDGAFVRQIGDDTTSAPILEAVIALGHALGVTVVAEHVETEHQARLLRELGCECGQGYYFGRPRPSEHTQSGRPRPSEHTQSGRPRPSEHMQSGWPAEVERSGKAESATTTASRP